MMLNILLPLLSEVAAHGFIGCRDDGDGRFNARIRAYHDNVVLHTRSQPDTQLAPEEHFRGLQWGDINIVHITDTHGWLAGHLSNQPEYAADWGDMVSFLEHIHQIAEKKDADLLVIETGDRHDGTGLSIGNGNRSQDVFAQLDDIDVLNIGNHELYSYEVADQEYKMIRPHYDAAYLASNVDIFENNEWIPAGRRFRILETKVLGYRVLTLGFIYDFKGNANGTRVTPAKEAIKQPWFLNVMNRTDYDLILLTGHIPVRGFDELDTYVDAIRKFHPNIPIQGLGGHTHVRDYRIFDSNAAALESGRYLETIGWASLSLTPNGTEFSRSYIDFSPENLAFHTNTSINATAEEVPFQTKKGLAVSQMIADIRKNLTLDNETAYVPQDYLTNWAPYPSNNSLFSLAADAHKTMKSVVGRDNEPRFILAHTGNYRYDLLKGPFSLDTKVQIDPYEDPFYYAKNLDIDLARKVLSHLNDDYSNIKKRSLLDRILTSTSATIPIPTAPNPTTVYVPPKYPATPFKKRTGYVTHDDAGSNGDDTPHNAYHTYDIPNAFQSEQNVNNSTEKVDLVFISYIKEDVTSYLKKQGWDGEVELYSEQTTGDLIESYIKNKN